MFHSRMVSSERVYCSLSFDRLSRVPLPMVPAFVVHISFGSEGYTFRMVKSLSLAGDVRYKTRNVKKEKFTRPGQIF